MMHWLEEEVEKLRQLYVSELPALEAGLLAAGGAAIGSGASGRREVAERFLLGLRQLVARTAEREGVTACFASYDGLVLESAGHPCDFEALSALAQVSSQAGHLTAHTLALGRISQMVIVGDEHKLALVLVGPVALGILAPVAVNLSATLS